MVMLMKSRRFLSVFALLAASCRLASADPITVNGDAFTLVATGPGTTQLFGLTSDAAGRIYIGNNSNNTTGIPLQVFNPALFSSVLQSRCRTSDRL